MRRQKQRVASKSNTPGTRQAEPHRENGRGGGHGFKAALTRRVRNVPTLVSAHHRLRPRAALLRAGPPHLPCLLCGPTSCHESRIGTAEGKDTGQPADQRRCPSARRIRITPSLRPRGAASGSASCSSAAFPPGCLFSERLWSEEVLKALCRWCLLLERQPLCAVLCEMAKPSLERLVARAAQRSAGVTSYPGRRFLPAALSPDWREGHRARPGVAGGKPSVSLCASAVAAGEGQSPGHRAQVTEPRPTQSPDFL